MSLISLAKFVENQSEPFELNVDPADEAYVLAQNFVKTFTTREKSENYGYTFRSSSIGKHPFLLAWDHYHKESACETITLSTRFKFLTGYAFESAFNMLLKQLGITYQSQTEISFTLADFTVGGHPDYVVDDPTGTWVLETKCVNGVTFNQWKKQGYVDRPEYQMQLAMYCLRQKAHGAFVVCNVDNGELALYPITYDDTVKKFKEKVILALSDCSFIVDCKEWVQTLTRIAPPDPPKRKDGTAYFPMSFYQGKGVLHPAAAIYEYHQRDDDTYEITGYNYPESMKEFEPVWS